MKKITLIFALFAFGAVFGQRIQKGQPELERSNVPLQMPTHDQGELSNSTLSSEALLTTYLQSVSRDAVSTPVRFERNSAPWQRSNFSPLSSLESEFTQGAELANPNTRRDVSRPASSSVVMSHSVDNTTLGAGTIACGGGGTTRENSWFRTYTPSDFGYSGDIQVDGLEFAYTFTGAGADGTGVIRAWTSDNVFPAGTFTQIAEAQMTYNAGGMDVKTFFPFDTPVIVDASTEIIVEVFAEDDPDNDIRIYDNNLGETAPSYVFSATCGLTAPTPMAAIGFPNNHIILDLVATEIVSCATVSDCNLNDATPDDATSPFIWDRPFAGGTCCSSLGPVSYDVYGPFTVDTSGAYDILSVQVGGWDGYLFVYETCFDPLDQLSGFVAGDDDGAGGIGTSDIIGAPLVTGTEYYVVTTGYSAGDFGDYETTINGPGMVTCGGGGGGASPCAYDNPSNAFENGLNYTGAFGELQNDLVLPDLTAMDLDQIVYNSFVAPGETIVSVDVAIYENLGAAPGSLVASYPAVAPTSQPVIGSNFGFDLREVTLDIPATALAGGLGGESYWIGFNNGVSSLGGPLFWEITSASMVGQPTLQDGTPWDPLYDGVYVFSGMCESIPPPASCGDFAYINEVPTGGGPPAQIFPDFPDFTSIAVDDVFFTGDAGLICSIDIQGRYTAGAPGLPGDPNGAVQLTIYNDDNGVPGDVRYQETFPGSVDADGDANFTLNPAQVIEATLNPDTRYWISVAVVMEFGLGGQWFWGSAEDTNDNAALWQNPGGGFGVCPTWGTFADCGVGGGLGPDLLMDIEMVSTDPLTYDVCAGARTIECNTSVFGDTLSATSDVGVAPDCDTSTGAPGVWYKFEDTSGLASEILLYTCSDDTDYDTKLSVYTGECGAFTCVVGNDDDCPNFQSSVEFVSDGNTTFYILVHGWNTSVGSFELTMECTLIPPPNNDIVNAIDLLAVGCPFTDEDVAMPAATEEAGTPAGCDISGAAGVWYEFTPEINGFITGTIASPAGVSSVTFYTAPDQSSIESDLVHVDYYQNQCLPGSSATIPVVGGQTYYCFVVNTGGVTDIIFDNCQLGTASNEIEGFEFYPNPTRERINLAAAQNIESVVLYNILGQRMIEVNVDATTTELNVAHLAAGAYLMEVTVDGQTGTYKVIKQ